TADCPRGQSCLDGRCVPGTDGATPFDAASCATPCATECCDPGELCVGGLACAPDRGPCATNADCTGDSYCDPASGRCIPWGSPPGMDHDPSCRQLLVAGAFSPTVQCELRDAPAGDPFPGHLHVLSTPMVVDFRVGAGPDDPPRPSIVAVFDDGADGSSEEPSGVIRILDGATCQQQAELGSLQLTSHSSPPAIGDLDGDGRPEIVAYKAGGGLVAFRFDPATSAWGVLWRSTAADGVTPYNPAGGGWAGPSLYDLDDDGQPEVLRGGVVLDRQGRLIDESVGQLIYGSGTFAVVADVDRDSQVELVAGHGVWGWSTANRRWEPEPYFAGGAAAGLVAIADFGAFPGNASWPADAPEVAVVTSGAVRVQTLDGVTVFGPVAIPGGGNGG
ncbi:MAG: hypothetical protein K8H88_06535, partial [Sandaracinaceae bacterium]|nr:hypothetical protein [Sandaracinaceae bacterium]